MYKKVNKSDDDKANRARIIFSDTVNLFDALPPSQDFEFILFDMREVEREELIKEFNDFIAITRELQFTGDAISQQRPDWLVAMLRITSIILSGRLSIDGKPLVIAIKD